MTVQDHAKNLAGYAAIAMFGMAGTPVVTWQSNPLLFLVFPSLIAAGLVGAFVYLVGSFLPTLMNEVRTAGYAELPQIAPQTKQESAQDEIEEISRNPTPVQSRPPQTPVREVRQAEYVTQAEPMRLSANALRMIIGDERFPYPQKWLHDLADARLNGDLADGVSDRQLGIAINIDRVNEAPHLKTWLIKRKFLAEDSKNWVHAWTPRGCIAFPVGE